MKKIILSTVICLWASMESFSQSDICVEYVANIDPKTRFNLRSLKCGTSSVQYINEINSNSDSIATFQSIRLKSNPLLIAIHKNGDWYAKILDQEIKEYKVKVVGKEKVNDYDCIKLRITTLDIGSCCSFVWVSNKVQDFEKLTDLNIHGLNIEKLNIVLKDLNIQGFPVRIEFIGDYPYTFDLLSIKFGDFSKSIAKFKPKEPFLDSLKRVGKISEQEYLEIKKTELDSRKAAENAAMDAARAAAKKNSDEKSNKPK